MSTNYSINVGIELYMSTNYSINVGIELYVNKYDDNTNSLVNKYDDNKITREIKNKYKWFIFLHFVA